jgi:hypothetical protein
MMEQNPARPARKVAIADHIWDLFEEMAQQMGSDRDALINQAMFMFAKVNGFIDAGKPAVAPVAPVATGKPQAVKPAPPVAMRAEPPAPAPIRQAPAPARLDDDPVRREVAERVLETAAELERLIKGKNDRSDEEEPADEPMQDEPLQDEEQLQDEQQMPQEESPEAPVDEAAGPQLYLMMEGGEMDHVAKERFVIGRGKHCDFVINSGKVSREHAMIVREGEEFFIEDLGSSNGTWFNKQRIKRRKIEDGDEYYICSEKLKVVMR